MRPRPLPPPRKPGEPTALSDDRVVGALLRAAILFAVAAIIAVVWKGSHPGH